MTIANYGHSAVLQGTHRDGARALHIAQELDLDTRHALEVADDRLTLEGMRAQMAAFSASVKPGDRVMVYFSGHGASYMENNQCVKALYAQDEKPLPSAEFNRFISGLRDKASQMISILDSCFSGGIADEGAIRGRAVNLRVKSAKSDCESAVNEGPITAQPTSRSADNLEQNYSYISAAQGNESSFESDEGGFTTKWLDQCLVPARTAGGVIQLDSAVTCAQKSIEDFMAAVRPDLRPAHISLVGKPFWTPPNAPMPSSGALDDIDRLFASRDPAWPVTLLVSPQRLRIGMDSMQIAVTSARDGYVYLFSLSSDGKTIDRLFPADASEAVHISANVPFALPYTFDSKGPAGNDHLLAIVSTTPRTFTIGAALAMAVPETRQDKASALSANDAEASACSRGLVPHACAKSSTDAPAFGAASTYIFEEESR